MIGDTHRRSALHRGLGPRQPIASLRKAARSRRSERPLDAGRPPPGCPGCPRLLRRNGIGPGDRVAIVTGDDKRVVAALLGARAIGALVLPPRADGRRRPRCADPPAPGGRCRAVPGVDTIDYERALREPGSPLPIAQGRLGVGRHHAPDPSGPPKTVVLTESSVAHVTAAVQELVEYGQATAFTAGCRCTTPTGCPSCGWRWPRARASICPAAQPTQARAAIAGSAAARCCRPSRQAPVPVTSLVRAPERQADHAGRSGADAGTRKLFASSQSSVEVPLLLRADRGDDARAVARTRRVLPAAARHGPADPRRARLGRSGRRAVGRGTRTWRAATSTIRPAPPCAFPEGSCGPATTSRSTATSSTTWGRLDGVFKRFGEKVIPERVEAALAVASRRGSGVSSRPRSGPAARRCLSPGSSDETVRRRAGADSATRARGCRRSWSPRWCASCPRCRRPLAASSCAGRPSRSRCSPTAHCREVRPSRN